MEAAALFMASEPPCMLQALPRSNSLVPGLWSLCCLQPLHATLLCKRGIEDILCQSSELECPRYGRQQLDSCN